MNDKKESIYVTKRYCIMCVIYVTCILASNIMAVKLVNVFGLTMTSAMFVFPITYILGDVFTEIYGFKKAGLAIWMGFICNALMVLLFIIMIKMPFPESWTNQEALVSVLGTTPRILMAGLIAYLFGGFSNSIIMSRLKVLTNGKHLWIRTIASTIVGEGLDCIIFAIGVFIGELPLKKIWIIIYSQFVWKVCYEILFTPLTYIVIGKIKKAEGIDVYDTNTKSKITK